MVVGCFFVLFFLLLLFFFFFSPFFFSGMSVPVCLYRTLTKKEKEKKKKSWAKKKVEEKERERKRKEIKEMKSRVREGRGRCVSFPPGNQSLPRACSFINYFSPTFRGAEFARARNKILFFQGGIRFKFWGFAELLRARVSHYCPAGTLHVACFMSLLLMQ